MRAREVVWNSDLDIILVGKEDGGLSGEGMAFREGNWALEERMGGGRIDCDRVWVWCRLPVSCPVTRVHLPWLMKLWEAGRGCMTVELLLEDLCLGQERGSEKASPCIGWFSRAFLSK